MILLTSNHHKIKEYKEFGIDAEIGDNVDEVLGTIDEVIIYKIIGSRAFVLLEDTVLKIDEQERVDSKFHINNIGEHDNACWITSLGYHDNTNLFVFRGSVQGKIVKPVVKHEYSFEPCFVPNGAEITLYELRQKGMKSNFSARRLAVEAFQNNQPLFSKAICDIPEWLGKYQNK